MKKLYIQLKDKFFLLLISFTCLSIATHAQVSNYGFTQSVSAYSAVTGGLSLGDAGSDDERFVDPAVPGGGTALTGVGLPIGFNFTYNGTVFDRLAVNANGWITLGQSALTPSVNMTSSSYFTNPLSSTATVTPAILRNRIAAVGRDLQAQTGASIRLETIGTAPNRVCIIQWMDYKRFGGTGTGDLLNFQIRLNETSNIVDVKFGSMVFGTGTGTNPQSGLSGTVSTDFNIRTSTTDWNATTAGTTNTAQITMVSTVTAPVSGRTFTWTAPVPCTGTPAPGNTLASSNPVCAGINFTLSLQNNPAVTGLMHQWQSAASAAGPWTNITGATSATLVTMQTDTTFYRAMVSCGANTGTSTAIKVGLNPQSACYCDAGATSTSFEKIGRVQYGNIDRTSTSTAGYENFLTDTANIVRQSTQPMTVTISGAFAADQVLVWADLNQDGDFLDPGELLYQSTTGVGPHVGMLTIPATANLGYTRLRVRMHDSSLGPNVTPCGNSTYGQVEDYTLNIIPCVQGVITTQPTNKTIQCGGNTTFNIAATGSLLTYKWQYRVSATAPWLFVPTGGVYSGETTNTLTITNAPISMNGYQYRAVVDGACTATESSSTATLTVNQMVATVNPPSAAICLGAVQQLTLTNILAPTTFNTNVSSGPIAVPIPDNTPVGATTNLTVTTAQVPAGAAVTAMALRINLPHTWMGDLIFALKAPNGNIVNLNFLLGNTGPAGGGGFVNTVISSTGTTALSAGFGNWTGTFRPDYATGVNGGPTGYTPTVTNFSGLYSTPQGTWTLAVWDAFSGDVGTITSWSLDFTYLLGTPATGVWSGPAGTIFTDMAATTPYTGAAANSVYVKPTVTSNYAVVITTPTCVSGSTTIPVSVSTPVGAITQPVATRTICVGANTTFTASALGGPLTTQWQVSTDAGATYTNVANAGVYSGATTNTLTITGATASMTGYRYRLAFNSAICSSTANSNAGILTVNPTPIVGLTVAPLTALYPGQTTTLSATVSPNAGATYTWTRNGVVVAGATAATLARNIDGLGIYSVRVTDVNGCTSTSSTVEIKDAANDILFIYPSPNTGQFQVRYYSGAGNNPLPRVINIYDAKGARIFSKKYTINVPYTRLDVNLSNHGRGIYNVELADETGQRLKTGRVVIF